MSFVSIISFSFFFFLLLQFIDLKPVQYSKCTSKENLLESMLKAIEEGGEGVVIRQPKVPCIRLSLIIFVFVEYKDIQQRTDVMQKVRVFCLQPARVLSIRNKYAVCEFMYVYNAFVVLNLLLTRSLSGPNQKPQPFTVPSTWQRNLRVSDVVVIKYFGFRPVCSLPMFFIAYCY